MPIPPIDAYPPARRLSTPIPLIDAYTTPHPHLCAAETAPWEGAGTLESPYEIADYEDLLALADADNLAEYGSCYFQQTANIDFSDIDGEGTDAPAWAGIGLNEKQTGTQAWFTGVYDGQGYKISNVTFVGNKVAGAGNWNYAGFFNAVDGATIKNLTIATLGFAADQQEGEFGGATVAGVVKNNAKFINVTAEGVIGTTVAPVTHNVAGFAVRVDGDKADNTVVAEFIDCTNKVDVVGNYTKIGAFVAFTQVGQIKFTNCSNEGDATALENAKSTGGRDGVACFVGWNGSDGAGGSAQTTFIGCSNTGVATPVEGKTAFGQLSGGQGGGAHLIDGGNNVMMPDQVLCPATQDVTTGFKYAIVDAGAANMVADADIAAGNTYTLMKGNVTPTFEFAAAGTIAFDEALVEAAGFNVTAGEGFEVDAGVKVGTVTTFTCTAKSTDPIDDPTELDEDGEANLAALKDALPAGTDINAWAAKVYADGKIPAAKLNKSSSTLIAAAAKYDLAVMADPVEVKVEATETANCFKFTLSDADKANPLVAATKIQKLVQYTTALGETTPFTESNAAAVTVAPDNATAPTYFTATFTGNDKTGEAAAAGFMKVEVK